MADKTEEYHELKIEFPVRFNIFYGKIYDARNREIATVRNYATNNEDRMWIGDFIADAMNRLQISESVEALNS